MPFNSIDWSRSGLQWTESEIFPYRSFSCIIWIKYKQLWRRRWSRWWWWWWWRCWRVLSTLNDNLFLLHSIFIHFILIYSFFFLSLPNKFNSSIVLSTVWYQIIMSVIYFFFLSKNILNRFCRRRRCDLCSVGCCNTVITKQRSLKLDLNGNSTKIRWNWARKRQRKTFRWQFVLFIFLGSAFTLPYNLFFSHTNTTKPYDVYSYVLPAEIQTHTFKWMNKSTVQRKKERSIKRLPHSVVRFLCSFFNFTSVYVRRGIVVIVFSQKTHLSIPLSILTKKNCSHHLSLSCGRSVLDWTILCITTIGCVDRITQNITKQKDTQHQTAHKETYSTRKHEFNTNILCEDRCESVPQVSAVYGLSRLMPRETKNVDRNQQNSQTIQNDTNRETTNKWSDIKLKKAEAKNIQWFHHTQYTRAK